MKGRGIKRQSAIPPMLRGFYARISKADLADALLQLCWVTTDHTASCGEPEACEIFMGRVNDARRRAGLRQVGP